MVLPATMTVLTPKGYHAFDSSSLLKKSSMSQCVAVAALTLTLKRSCLFGSTDSPTFFFFSFFLHKCSLAACLIPEQGYFAIIADCFVLIYFHGTHCSRALYGAPSCSSFQETNKPTAAEMWGRHWGNWMAGERLGWFLSGVGTTQRCMGTSSPPQSASLITIG